MSNHKEDEPWDWFPIGTRMRFEHHDDVDVNGHPKAYIGTLIGIDISDSGLPWAVTHTPVPNVTAEEAYRLFHNSADWSWVGPSNADVAMPEQIIITEVFA